MENSQYFDMENDILSDDENDSLSYKNYTADENYRRLDVFLSEISGLTRSAIKKLTEKEKVLINGKVAKASDAVKLGQTVTLIEEEPQKLNLTPQNIDIDIVYQDEYLAVINKPQGLTVHPAPGNYDKTLVNALLYHIKNLSSINGVIRPGIVHRLDKDTSGLLVIAKCDIAHVNLSKQIAEKTCHRIYHTICEGVIKTDKGTISANIGRSRADRKKMAVTHDGRSATTHYKVLQRFKNNTYLELQLVTGRTHQIRVHLKHINHPVIGDTAYGYAKQRFNLSGQLLHAHKLIFTHPITGKEMEFTAPLPDYFNRVLKILKND